MTTEIILKAAITQDVPINIICENCKRELDVAAHYTRYKGEQVDTLFIKPCQCSLEAQDKGE